MKRKRKQYSGAFKAKVGLEALMGVKTTAQIARDYEVHPLMVSQWKGLLRERMPELFERGNPVPDESEKIIAQLHQKIGQLTVDLDWLKKKVQTVGTLDQRRALIEEVQKPSIRHQCELLNISRTAYYYEPCPESEENLRLMRELDELHMKDPVYGSRRLTVLLGRRGYQVNRKRVIRLLRTMGIEAIYPKRQLSRPGEGHEIYPYLLKGLEISGPNQVWCSDITYIPMQYGFMYLVAVMDWWSRYVLAWALSNTMEAEFCIRAWEAALAHAGRAPLISNTDQGSQFTSPGFIGAVQAAGTQVSMDGRGRWIDNRFIERLWRSVKYEDVYLKDYANGLAAGRGLGAYFGRYNGERPHQALCDATPEDWYRRAHDFEGKAATWEAMQSSRPRRRRQRVGGIPSPRLQIVEQF